MEKQCHKQRYLILDEIYRARRFFCDCHSNLAWGFINAFMAIIIYLELSYGNIINSVSGMVPSLYLGSIAVGLLVLLLLNVVFHFIKYIRTQSFKPVEVPITHKKLCGINESEHCFRVTSTPVKRTLDFSNGPNFSPSNYNAHIGINVSNYESLNSSYHSRSRSPSAFHKDEHNFSLGTNYSIRSMSSQDTIDSFSSLNSFLEKQSEHESKLRRIEQAFESKKSPKYNLDTSFRGSSGRHQYQLARSPPQQQPVPDAPQDTTRPHSPVDSNIWSKLNISAERIDLWTERLRKYLGQTILVRLSESITSTNKALVSAGHEDIQIGYVNLATLKHFAASKPHFVPQLGSLIPFLEASTNQEYLVQRIKELSSGGCISSFKWSSGGEFRDKKWEENLPTDSAILMHFLCCYLDSRLPTHPKFLEGKTFTSQHFFRATDKPTELKESACFLEARTNPPHYDVVSEGSSIRLKKGRLNLFHAILLFFYLIKVKEHGMLRRVSLGLSGINILWIFDD